MTINLQLLNDSLNDLVEKTISIVAKLINECDIQIK